MYFIFPPLKSSTGKKPHPTLQNTQEARRPEPALCGICRNRTSPWPRRRGKASSGLLLAAARSKHAGVSQVLLHTQHIMLLSAAKALGCATSCSQSAHTSPRGSGSNDWKRTASLIPCLQGKGWGCFWLCCVRTSDAHLQAQISWGKV